MWKNFWHRWKRKVYCVWNDLHRAARIPLARQVLLGEALLALLMARGAMALFPFRRIAAWLGTAGWESPLSLRNTELLIAKRVGWAVGAVARRVPWDGRCLAQALAATWMVRRRGLEGTVSFGAGRGEAAEFTAHAWLRVGTYIVTGGPGHQRFKTFTTFSRRQQ
jgi:hypothetical protein